MKIGIVLSKTPEYSETFFISKIKGLQNYGHRVVLYVQTKDPEFTLCEVKVVQALGQLNLISQSIQVLLQCLKLLFSHPKRLSFFVKLERASKRSIYQILKNIYNNSHLLKAKVDWLHFGFATIALQSENVAIAINAKMAVSLRGFDVDVFPLKHRGCYDLLWQKVDKVHAISEHTLERGRSLGLSLNKKAKIIYPALNATKYMSLQKSNFEKTVFLTIGRLHEIKGFNFVLEAMAKLKEFEFEYHIVGDGPELKNLKQLSESLGLEKKVTFAGKIPHDQVLTFYEKSNYYIQYSLSEGFCNATLEAQASGLLCIVSDGGGLKENVIHNKTGWVVPKRNPIALSNCITEVLNLPNTEKYQIIKNARSRVASDFSLDEYEQKFDAFYKL